MWRCSETELYCVSTNIRSMLEWIAFEIGMSISRYFPAKGTAGLALRRVSGSRRSPRPPPRISTITSRARSLTPMPGPRGSQLHPTFEQLRLADPAEALFLGVDVRDRP